MISMKKRRYRAHRAHKRRKVSMARRRYYPRRSFSRRRSNGGGLGLKSMLAPIAGGFADAVINPRLPVNGVGSTAIGIFMHNTTIKDIGLYQIGQSIATFVPGLGAVSGGVASQV